MGTALASAELIVRRHRPGTEGSVRWTPKDHYNHANGLVTNTFSAPVAGSTLTLARRDVGFLRTSYEYSATLTDDQETEIDSVSSRDPGSAVARAFAAAAAEHEAQLAAAGERAVQALGGD